MRAIFITGAASGIGRAVAQRFHAEGWQLGLADVAADALAATAATLPGARAFPMDVRSPDQWHDALAQFTAATGGRLDALFNNAGIAVAGPLAQTPLADLDRLIDVNLKGVFHGARAAYPHLAATPGSVLVNTASASSLYAPPNMAGYAATKFGVRALTESLAQEWAADGIRVAAIMPGFIDTPLLQASSAGSNTTMRDGVVAMKLEFVPVEEVADHVWRAVTAPGPMFRIIGPTARRLAFWSRWSPGTLIRRATRQARVR